MILTGHGSGGQSKVGSWKQPGEPAARQRTHRSEENQGLNRSTGRNVSAVPQGPVAEVIPSSAL